MFSQNNKISTRQLRVLLILDVFGTGVIVLPRRAAEFASQDGWLLIIIATALAALFGFIITTLSGMFPGESFIAYASNIIGKPIAALLGLGLTAKILLSAAMELRFFGEIVKQILLPNTPFYIVAVAVLLTGAYAAAKGYETRARLGEILIPIVLVPIIVIFCLAAVKSDFTNVMPILEASPRKLIIGGFFCSSAFTGIELILLVNPYINQPKKIRSTVLTAIPIIGALMLFITFVTICEFGAENVKNQMWPVIEMMDVTDFPGAFVERQTAFIMSFWIISVFAIINAALFFSSILLKDMFEKTIKNAGHTIYILICIPIILLLSLLPRNITQAAQILDFIFLTFSTAYFFIIPLALLLIAKARRLRKS